MYLNFFAPWLCPTIHLPILCLDTKTKKRELLSRSMMGHFDNEIDCGPIGNYQHQPIGTQWAFRLLIEQYSLEMFSWNYIVKFFTLIDRVAFLFYYILLVPSLHVRNSVHWTEGRYVKNFTCCLGDGKSYDQVPTKIKKTIKIWSLQSGYDVVSSVTIGKPKKRLFTW